MLKVNTGDMEEEKKILVLGLKKEGKEGVAGKWQSITERVVKKKLNMCKRKF